MRAPTTAPTRYLDDSVVGIAQPRQDHRAHRVNDRVVVNEHPGVACCAAIVEHVQVAAHEPNLDLDAVVDRLAYAAALEGTVTNRDAIHNIIEWRRTITPAAPNRIPL